MEKIAVPVLKYPVGGDAPEASLIFLMRNALLVLFVDEWIPWIRSSFTRHPPLHAAGSY